MIREAIQEFGQIFDDRSWTHDRTQTVGASEIGLCARKIHWLKKSGARDVDFISHWGAHVRGTLMEREFWLPAMKAQYDDKLIMAGKEQKTLQHGFLSATPDGLLIDQPSDALKNLGVDDIGGSEIVVECKTIDPRVSLTKERESNHYQIQVQMGLIREKTPYKPSYGLISYIDASFWDDVEEFVVPYDEGVYAAAQVRAQRILQATDPKELKPEGWIAGGYECEHCPFTEACGIIRRSVPEREAAADPQFVAEIADLCREAQDAQSQIESLQAEVRETHQEIKDRMRQKSVRRVPGVVTWSAVKGRTTYDIKGIKSAAAAAGVDVEAFASVGDSTDRLQISVGRPSAE